MKLPRTGPIARVIRDLRTPGYRRTLAVRRTAAILLACMAVIALLRPLNARDPLVVAFSTQVEAGSVLSEGDLHLVRVPAELVPEHTFSLIDDAVGSVTVAHGSPGQIVSAQHLVNPAMTDAFVSNITEQADSDQWTMVPVTLAEPDVIPLLQHGDEISVVSHVRESTEPQVITRGGRVILAGEQGGDTAETILVLLPEEEATKVASASLSLPLAVVLTGDRAS